MWWTTEINQNVYHKNITTRGSTYFSFVTKINCVWSQYLMGKENTVAVGNKILAGFFSFPLTAFWKLRLISAWNQKWERKRCPHILSSVFGMNSVRTLKISGKKKTNLFCKKGKFLHLCNNFYKISLMGTVLQKIIVHTKSIQLPFE